jgi:uncharacterized protein with NAD-binding domain and iron-sulfur cluster
MSGRDVVIVGGGIAGLTAAFEVTDRCHCPMREHGCVCMTDQRHVDCPLPRKVTVYERRTELGGKGASVRNERLDNRIEEHGLHIWFGYYENAFRLLDRCHRELELLAHDGNQPRWCTMIASVADGFRPASTVGLADDDAFGSWTRWFTTFPEDQALPWNRTDLDPPAEFELGWFLPEVGRRTTALLHAALRSVVTGDDPGYLAELVEEVDLALGDVDPVLDQLFRAALWWSNHLKKRSGRMPRPALVSLAISSLEATSQLLEYVRNHFDVEIAGNSTARRLLTIVDLLVGSTRGMLASGIATEADIDRLDDWEWSDWLAANGVVGASRDSALVRALSYCLPFAYQGGSRDAPSFSAAVGVRLFVRSFFTYRGALMWKMNHGMGEVVFAPLYELLCKRGVEFRFEHDLIDVEIDEAEGRVSKLVFDKPDLGEGGKQPSTPWPLEKLKFEGGTLCYWPLREPSKKWTSYQLNVSACDVVLAVPLPMLKYSAPTLLRSTRRWRELVSGRPLLDGFGRVAMGSVTTQAAQLWLTKEAAGGLGWPSDVTVSGFSEPYDTFSDMSELLPSEGVPKKGPEPKGLVYLCSTRADGDDLGELEDAAWNDLNQFLWERAPHLWPNAVTMSGRLEAGLVIDVDLQGLLRQRGKPRASSEPRAPYVRVNAEPADRYVLSLPGSASLRIEPGDTGYLNLFAAGDWTACVLNAGCIEGAAISGMLAAEALLEIPLAIVGRAGSGRQDELDSSQRGVA